jgi:hypothetical protein
MFELAFNVAGERRGMCESALKQQQWQRQRHELMKEE